MIAYFQSSVVISCFSFHTVWQQVVIFPAFVHELQKNRYSKHLQWHAINIKQECNYQIFYFIRYTLVVPCWRLICLQNCVHHKKSTKY